MTKLDEFIQELCPDGVKYLPIPELFITRNGYTPSKANNEFWENGTIPWFRMEDIRENGRILTTATQYVSEKAAKGKLFPADSIIIATSATIGEHALIKVPSLANQRFTYLTLKDEFKDCVDMMFVFYYCFRLDEYCKSHLNQGNFASVDMKQFAAFKFPVPPLPVQREIVRILDNFTELTEGLNRELAAELTARKQQYAYYRNSLLSFKYRENTVKKALSEIAEISTGSSNSDEAVENGQYPFYVRSQQPLAKNEYEFDEEAVITAGDGVGVGKVFHYASGKYALHQRAYRIHPTSNSIMCKYLYYYFVANFPKYIGQQMYQGSVPSIRRPMLNQFEVSVPSLEIQKRLVEVLDNFDALCTNLSSGLPAEIEARQKQYEYYRDKLLTFTPAD